MKIDKTIMFIPLILIIILSILFAVFSDISLYVTDNIRNVMGNDFALVYLLFGLMCFGMTLYYGFGKHGKIILGNEKKASYKNWIWGSMIFTSTMAADIIFFSLIEWAYYANEAHVLEMGNVLLWSATMPLFHWGPIVWSFYIVIAIPIGYMIHKKGVTTQKFSEMCRPLLGKRVDGLIGKAIDIIAIFGLIAGTATTFSLATPLITSGLSYLLGLQETTLLTVMVLLGVAIIYTIVVLSGMKGIEKLAKISIILFIIFLLYVLFVGGETRFILETGFAAIGNITQNFLVLATWTDPARNDYFPQNWTVFYWAYWIAWSVATPFFIANISKGRSIRNTVFGVYFFGILGTFTSFIILGGHGMAQQFLYGIQIADLIGYIDESRLIIGVLQTIPFYRIGLFLLVITMILFYATTFDSLTLVISNYSYKELGYNEPSKGIRAFWAITFIILPIGFILSQGALYSLQAVAIIAAAPIAVIIACVVWSFLIELH